MNHQEELLLNEIVKYVKENHVMPTRRYLQNKLHYKSVNSITQYIKSLIKQNYLKYNNGKLILYNESLYHNNLKVINVLNIKNKSLSVILNKNRKYVAFQIKNDYFQNIGILKHDLLIIEIVSNLNNGNLGLFIIDNAYRIMKYNYIDGYYILKDNEELILSKIHLIGKVIMIERKI